MFQMTSDLFLLHDDVKFYAALKSNLQDESSAHLSLSPLCWCLPLPEDTVLFLNAVESFH